MTQDEIYRKMKEILVEYFRLEEDEVTPETHLIDDLGADSIAIVEMSFRISECFSVPIVEADNELLVVKNMAEKIYRQINIA
ncbi:acyl carrier protein [Ruminiclostridium sufflavum DSM 19573]|uniref:Acyl carrier protein n=1 Tax=Ruminiclostridium sufflavum DSM 19573 TaxID=1121337 RepID=A0A318XK28_9FIRM|nr:phosphopantetheine-binding protein [Ruminiclostridium sufflavum]PYG85777.1 acyl carrier protein [Ruminiclostridium sufflavum DSM 19573]